jgi:P-type E1-E2 ATPase
MLSSSKHNDSARLEYEQSEVQHLRVGDMIKLKDDDYVPADCIILQAAHANGQSFTQTDALDGERNFKSKLPLTKS